MRRYARLTVYVAAVVLSLPAVVWAQSPAPGQAWAGSAPTQKPKRNWFGRGQLCVDCKRAKEMAKHGVHVPPPPPLPGASSNGQNCSSCGNPLMVLSTSGPMTVAPPQYDSGGVMYATGDNAGFASTHGDPTPVGTFTPKVAAAPAQARGPQAAPGSHDPSVGMTSYAPTPVIPLGANRPRVLSHLLGFSEIGRDWRSARERRREEAHASIRMGVAAPPVDALPARMVYGR